jgi:hypothetical protein
MKPVGNTNPRTEQTRTYRYTIWISIGKIYMYLRTTGPNTDGFNWQFFMSRLESYTTANQISLNRYVGEYQIRY